MEEAIKEAEKAYKEGDVPVGAVLVYTIKLLLKIITEKKSIEMQ